MSKLCWWLPLLAEWAMAASPEIITRRGVVFEPNVGQADAAARFLGSGAGGRFRLESGAVVFAGAGPALRLRFENARSPATLEGEEPLPGKSFYYLGADPARWLKNVPNYGRVRYRGLYPGIDAVFYEPAGARGELEYDLVLAPHANPGLVQLTIEGVGSISVTPGGDLSMGIGARAVVQRRPRVFQGGREIAARYRVSGMRASFELGAYDAGKPLRIDPTLAYASYFGGNGSDDANAIISDGSGNVYVAGQTASVNFPPGPLPSGDGPRGGLDVFLTKFDSSGRTVLFSVLLGSSADDTARNVTVDASGNVYLVGQTQGSNFPTLNPYQAKAGAPPTGFVAKLDSSGSLIFSTYLGGFVSPPMGTFTNTSTAIQTAAADGKGNVWVGGWTFATDFPSTLGPAPDPAHYPYAFLTGFDAAGRLLGSMTFSGAYNDISLVTAIALDGSGNIVAAGSTAGGLAPTAGVVQPNYAGGPADGFVMRINPSGTAANYITALTYLGGSGLDEVSGLALDGSGNVYVTGTTNSKNFPGTSGGMQASLTGISGGFVAKLNAALTVEPFATYLGGATGTEATPRDVGVDASGNVFVAGYTDYSDLTPSALGSNAAAAQPKYGGNTDGFVLELNPEGSTARYFTYFGGSAADNIFGMTLDGAGNLYAAGRTSSPDLPVSQQAFQGSLAAAPDGFFLKLNFASPGAVAITSVNVAGLGSANLAQNAWIEIHGSNFAPAGTAATWSSAPDFSAGKMPATLSGVSVAVNGKAAFLYYVSPAQVNVLTPLDSTTGPVRIVLTAAGGVSAPFTASLQTVSPSFLLFGATRYAAATHADGSLLGPASLSAPGYTFSPAKPGETIVVYGAGFGLPAPPASLVNGSSTQNGALGALPSILIGGAAAQVAFAGVVSPGLYQFNVVVPAGTPGGDSSIQAAYGGFSTPAGDLISVQP